MADNVAQSIKDLDERIKSLDKGLQNTMNLSKAIAENSDMLGNVMMQALKKGSDESKEAVKNLKELNKTITDTFGSGKEIKIAIGIEKDRLKKEIAETEDKLKDFRDKKRYTKNLEIHLLAYKEQLAQLGNFEKVYARINQIANAGKSKEGTAWSRARADEMNARKKAIDDVTRTEGRLLKLEQELSRYKEGGSRWKNVKSQIEAANKELEVYREKLKLLASRGKSALDANTGTVGFSKETKQLIQEGRDATREAERLAKVRQKDAEWQEQQRRNTEAQFVANGKAIEQQRKLADQIDVLTRKRQALAKYTTDSSAAFDSRNYPLASAYQKQIEDLIRLRQQLDRQFSGSMKAGDLAFADTKTLRDQEEAQKRITAEQKQRDKERADAARQRAAIERKADSESLANQRRQIQIKAQLSAIDKARNSDRDVSSKRAKTQVAEENAEYKRLSAELTRLIARQKELNAISQGSGRRARGRLQTYEITASEQALRRYEEAWRRVNREQKSSDDNMRKMLSTVSRLASAFGVAFSVQGLVQFGKKLVETRGQFEMQFVAMKQIIGDVDAATKIWNQTMQQALQSPFKAMQLVDYTKKLAAYRIETDKLFDTTKRLADVSAGLGVDMGRLILAYGQVKTANYLRASEVRQFTEAGVNIYDNLANYFSEIEGRAVTVSEVIDRVTKRMVLFSDVEEIFKRMTDEGGVFFNMQEVQADTVRGQIMKLHDAYDQMLNTIGQANQGTLRNLTETANRLVRNWRDVAAFLKAQIPIFAVMLPYWISMRKIQRMTAEESALLTSRLATLKMSLLSTTKSTKSATLALHEQRAAMMRQRREMALYIERMKRLVKNKELLTRATRMWTRSMKTSMIQSAAFDTVLKSLIVSGEMLKSTLRSIAPFLAIEGIIFLVNSLTSASRKAAEFKKELRELTDEQMGRGDEEANEYKRLIKELEATNEGSIERAKVIQKINDKYGVYLDNLYNESSSLEDVANGYEVVAERAKEAARARALEDGYSKILGKYNQERSDSIFDLAKHPHGYSGGFGKAGTFLSTGGTFDISKDDAKGFSEYVDEIVEKNEELYASMSQVERQEAIRQLYKDYFGKELPAGAAQLFNFIDNTVDRLAALKDYEQSLEKDFNLKGLNKELRDTIIGIRDDAKELISQIEGAKRGDSIILPIGMKLDIKKTRDDADTDVNSILTYIKRRVEEQSKQKEIDLRLSSGIIGEEEAKKLRDRIGRLTDETANQINDKIIKQIKEAYNVTGDLLDYIEKNPWDKNMGEMFAAINSGLITQNDIVQGIGKAEEVIQGRLQGQLSVLQDINKKKNSGLITDKAQLDALLKQERSVQTTYQWLQKTLFLLKNRAEVSEVQSALLDNTTIDKAKERVRKKFGENVANEITIGYAFDYANVNMVQSAVAEAYHKAGDEIDKEIKSIKASANADKEKIKMLERQRDIQYELANAYGYVDKKARTGGQKESVSRLISLIKEMRSEYDKLSKSAYGYAKSEEKVRASFGDSWEAILKEAGVPKDFDFSTNAGEIAALERVRDYVKGNAKFAKDAWKDVQKVIDQLKTESEIEVQVRIREDFGRQMEEAFGNYELTLELQKINMPADAAKDILGLDYTSLNSLLDRVRKFRNDLENTVVGQDENGDDIIEDHFDKDDQQVYANWMKKIEDQLFNMRKERAKQYTKYLEQELSERAKLEMQYVKDVAFVEANFRDEQKDAIKQNLQTNYEQALKELEWKSFKESDFYVEMMQDLTSMPSEYLDLMMQKLNEWAAKADVLSPRALKEVLRAREKVMAAQVALSPVRALGQSLNVINDFQSSGRLDAQGEAISKNIKKSREQMQGIIVAREQEILKTKEQLDLEQQKLGKIKAQEEIQESLSQLTNKGVEGLQMTANADQDIANIERIASRYDVMLQGLLVGGGVERGEGEEESDFLTRKRQYEDEVREIQAILKLLSQLREQREGAAVAGVDPTQDYSASKAGTIKNVTELGEKLSKLEKEQVKDQGVMTEGYAAWNKAVHGLAQNIADITGKVKDMGNQLYDTLQVLGMETDVLTDAWKDFGNSMVDVILQALEMIPTLVTGFTSAGVAINAAMGIIGLIALAIQAVLTLISGLAKIHDAGLERDIQKQQEKIDDLTDAYARLEKQIEKTWDSVSYMQTYEEQAENIREQIAAMEAQMAAEEAKKNTDDSAVRQYKNDIQDAYDQLEELEQKQIEVFGGIGEEGYRSAAEGFVDAWKSAFLETGDGLQGLQDHFDEFLQDWFTKQATMLIARKYLDNMFSQIDEAVKENSDGGVEVMWGELERIMQTASANFPEFSEKLEEFFRRFGGFGGGSLSGLAAGIQGMTEEQANILEAYWNSVRMYTASIDVNVARIAAVITAAGYGTSVASQMTSSLPQSKSDAYTTDVADNLARLTRSLIDGDVNTNPMLRQMTLIAQNTNSINTLLQSVIKSGHSMGGYGLKVFQN